MKIEKNAKDLMTPIERKKAIQKGERADRVMAMPFTSEFKCYLSGISVRDFWFDVKKMAQAERIVFNRYGYDRIVIGPNTRGIVEALGGKFIYPENGVPYADAPMISDYKKLDEMEPVEAKRDSRIAVFIEEAKILSEEAQGIVPIEASIGGPFTITSSLRGVEKLLRDCRKYGEEVHRLMRIVTDSQKSCIDMATQYGLGIAMADPGANPALIGPKMYEKFVFPYTKELTDYAYEKTGHKVSLHMCGDTRSIWKYLGQYQLNELSLDNIIDIKQAADEIGSEVPIAGNVDPVSIVMKGTKEEIFADVKRCVEIGSKAKKGYTLATGCDIPETTDPQKIDWFMDAARACGEYKG